MQIPLAIVAYPALLAAIYAIYRIGRMRERPRLTSFEWVRVCTLAAFLGAVVAIQTRLAADGAFATPWSLVAGVGSIAATVGLVGLNVLDWLESFENSMRGRFVIPATPR